jgi:amidohydrolase
VADKIGNTGIGRRVRVLDYFRNELPAMTAWRRDFHRHPEIGFEEHRTAARIAELLAGWGLRVETGIGGTGVVGVLAGHRRGTISVGFRAELDALPMPEKADVSYRSTTADRFHGCGHDGHAATLLAAARYLAHNNDLAGRVCFIFQPAEETLRGARAMLEDGLLTTAPVDEIYALHNIPGLAAGKVGVRAGAILSGADHLRIVVKGVGTHGAQPHRGIDPIVIACELVGLLQTTVSRSLDALDPGVVTIGIISGGTAANVIPDEVTLTGTIRSMSAAGRALLQRRVRELCDGLAACFGATILCTIDPGCPPTINHAVQAAVVATVAERVVGRANVVSDVKPIMASEDFSFMLEQRPGAFFFIGQDGPSCHHPEYVFDDAVMPIGAAMIVEIARERLKASVDAPCGCEPTLAGPE